MGAGGPGAALRANLIVKFFSPLKNMMDGNLVFPRPLDEFINKRAYPTLDLMWGRGLSRQNGRWRMGGGLKANLIVEFFFRFSPEKYDGRKFSLSVHPR
jgi:hypothetical protein